MPQIAAITLADRETTPVNHVFNPVNVVNGVGYWIRSTGVPIADEKLSVSVRKVNKKSKSRQVLSVPVTQTVTGSNGITSTIVVRVGTCEVGFTFDETSTVQERKNVVGMVANGLLANQAFLSSIHIDLENPY